MSDLPLAVPCDLDAERELCGAVLNLRAGYSLALQYTSGEDFYSPRLGRIFEAVPQGWKVPRPPEPEPDDLAGWWAWSPETDRANVVAEHAGVSLDEVERLRDRSAWQVERAAQQVAEMARRRRAMHALQTAYTTIGSGGSVEEVREFLERAVA